MTATLVCRFCGFRDEEHDPIDMRCPDDEDQARFNERERGDDDFTDCRGSCGDCDACACAGDDEYSRRKDEGLPSN